MSALSTEVVPGPIGSFSNGYAHELARQGYARRTICTQMRLLADLDGWLRKNGLNAGNLKQDKVDLFLRDRCAVGCADYSSSKAVRPILDYLRGSGVVSPPEAAVVDSPVGAISERFSHFLTVERSLLPLTASRYVDLIRPFLEGRVAADGLSLNLGGLASADVIAFVASHCPRQNRGVAKLTVTALRSFLGFLHLDGIIERSLVAVVPSVANRRMAGLPKGLDPEQVQRLLASCDDTRQSGCRDIAILTMMLRLGLRRSEVAKLQLDDIDWRTGEIVVHGKGSCTERIPLPPDVGLRLAEYLRRGRPASAQSRAVFVRINAPHRNLSSARVSTLVADAARRANLGRVHAHRLRHTAAMQMLRAGASLPEIGQLLRHRHAQTTAIYAKVDRDALRVIARPWPGDVA